MSGLEPPLLALKKCCRLMIERINLLTVDTLVRSPDDIVYSTAPRKAEGENETTYVIKGPDPEVVFAELAGCALAREVGLIVPDVVVGEFDGDTYAAIALVEGDRDISHWLSRPTKVANLYDLFSAVIVDVWLVNGDRNMGNVLGKSTGDKDKKVGLVFIDFEKSTALRPFPIVSSPMVLPRQLWPTSELGEKLALIKPLVPPATMVERIHSLPSERCTEVVNDVVIALDADIAWKDDSVHTLISRASQIQHLVEEVWATIK